MSKCSHEMLQCMVDIYVHRLRLAIGGMAAVLSGMDALVFTAGVGENSPEIRAAACDTMEFLGLRLDDGKMHTLLSTQIYRPRIHASVFS
jgi:acetate kinase